MIDPDLLRSDNFEAFMLDRQKRLLRLIEKATGKSAYTEEIADEGEDIDGDDDTIEAKMIIKSFA